MSDFGDLFKELRIQCGQTLRKFCIKHDLDPGYMSKLERGRVRSPDSIDQLRQYAGWLGIGEDTELWKEFFLLAIKERVNFPDIALSDEELVGRLPMLRPLGMSDKQFNNLVERIRRV